MIKIFLFNEGTLFEEENHCVEELSYYAGGIWGNTIILMISGEMRQAKHVQITSLI